MQRGCSLERASSLECELEKRNESKVALVCVPVLDRNLFHYIPQPMAALREMRRVLRTGGALVITDWCDDYLACRVRDWYFRQSNRAHRGIYGEKNFRLLLEQAEFRDVEVERYKISWLWGLMTARTTK